MTHLLFIDDEAGVLHSLSRICRDSRIAPVIESLKITILQGPRDALQFVRHTRVDVIVANYRMVEMSGTTLLAQLGAVQPHAARIILSVRADRDAVRKAAKTGGIFRFLAKPWSDADLKHTIFEALVASRNGAEYDRGPDTVWGSEESAPRKPLAELGNATDHLGITLDDLEVGGTTSRVA